ncbi:PhnD/SsuA/transferrin family substrate-binding protein [Paludibaculum fermentans]|uniref:PhnD/SsuA/transferrin family substrate-binding protein n=1 Tax=Paludibaculum fermentans TaxID=1473598 RepID=UPI003EBF5ABF
MPAAWSATEQVPPLRLAVSESLVMDVNTNDASAAMSIWVKRIAQEMNIAVDYNTKAFDTSQEILNRARKGLFDAVALNVLEYRQVAETLDSSQVVAEGSAAGPEQYLILVKNSGSIHKPADLKGSRLMMLKNPRMCVAPAWLTTVLDGAYSGPGDKYFASVLTDSKVGRVVLPVFFGQADACITTKRGFDSMCELNPQVAKELKAIATSPGMIVNAYFFRKNYQTVYRERFVKALSGLRSTAAGRQLAMLFQFDELTLRDASCFSSALSVLEAADRIRGRRGPAGRKDI